MKSDVLPKGFPTSPEEWEKLMAAAPAQIDDPECPYDPNDPAAVEAYWKNGVVVKEGGYPAVREALAKRRRGPNKHPTKEQVAIRFDRDVLDAFRATGKGWQTRMNEALREWLETHRAAR